MDLNFPNLLFVHRFLNGLIVLKFCLAHFYTQNQDYQDLKILKHKNVLGLVFIKKQKTIAKNVLELKISKPTYIV